MTPTGTLTPVLTLTPPAELTQTRLQTSDTLSLQRCRRKQSIFAQKRETPPSHTHTNTHTHLAPNVW